jgi:hypothetical protein
VFCSKSRTCNILAHSQGPRWMRKPVLSLCPSLCPRADLKALSGGQDQLHRLTSLLAHRGGLHQGKAHWLDLPLQPLPPCIKRRAAYSVLLTERLYRLPTLLLTGNQLAPVLPSLRHPLLVAHATTMRPSTPCGLVVFIGCLRVSYARLAPSLLRQPIKGPWQFEAAVIGNLQLSILPYFPAQRRCLT